MVTVALTYWFEDLIDCSGLSLCGSLEVYENMTIYRQRGTRENHLAIVTCGSSIDYILLLHSCLNRRMNKQHVHCQHICTVV